MKRIFLSLRELGLFAVMCMFVTGLSAQRVSKYLKECRIYAQEDKYGIAFRGKPVISPAYEKIVSLTDHVFRIKENGKYGLLSAGFSKRKGHERRLPHAVAEEEIEGGKYYISFFLSEPCVYDRIELWQDDYMLVCKGEHQGLMNKYGDRIIPCKYDGITRRENVYYVKAGGVQGVYNRYGDVIVPCRYTEIEWTGNVYKVREGNKYGVINKYGDRIVAPVYTVVENKDEVYWVEDGEKRGIINRYGDIIVPCRYSEVVWDGNTYSVSENNKYGIINKYGNVIVPCEYGKLTKIREVYFVEKEGLHGVYDRFGNRLLSCKFDSINLLRDGKFLTEQGGRKRLYNRFGHLISDYSEGSVYYSTSDQEQEVK